ncbi:Putative ribonuclease H protein At1g65750 [Linum perenne]
MNSEQRSLGISSTRVRSDICWDPGASTSMILNTDGSVNLTMGRAAAGGLIRDELGRCSCAFTINLGICSITRAELRGIAAGLQLAWDAGHHQVAVQTDSQAVIRLIWEEGVPSHQHASEVIGIRDLLQREWVVTISHVFREANKSADFLASLGHDRDLGLHLIDVSDCNLGYFVRLDCMGISEPILI